MSEKSYIGIDKDINVLCDLLGFNATQRKTRYSHICAVLTDVHRNGYFDGLRNSDYITKRFKECEREKQSYIRDLCEVRTLLNEKKIDEAIKFLDLSIGGLSES